MDYANASPRPWRAMYTRILDARGKSVCVCEKDSMHGRADDETAKADVALIVEAVNERDRLRDIVRRLCDELESHYYEPQSMDDPCIVREARAAIGEGD